MTNRPELQKDAKGLLPGEAEHGVPDFLRRETIVLSKEAYDVLLNAIENPPPPTQALIDLMRLNLATDPQATAPSWVPPWSTSS